MSEISSPRDSKNIAFQHWMITEARALIEGRWTRDVFSWMNFTSRD